jgi:Ala-tRNA(Pro) deacylase
MIPANVEAHLRAHHPSYEHHRHAPAMSGQALAHAEHVTGYRVAKVVAVKVGGRRALAVVSAAEKVRLGVLEEATGCEVELVPEGELWGWFKACEVGAEPPLAFFGMPIFADAGLLREKRIVMPGGTYQDSIVVDTEEWARCEKVQEIPNLAAAAAPRPWA